MFGRTKNKDIPKKETFIQTISAFEAKEKSLSNLEASNKKEIAKMIYEIWERIHKSISEGDTWCARRVVYPHKDILREVTTYFRGYGYTVTYYPPTFSFFIKWG